MKKTIILIVFTILLVSCAKASSGFQDLPESMQPTKTPVDISVNGKFLILQQRDYYLVNSDGTEQTLLYSGETTPAEMASLSPSTTKFAYFTNNFVYIQDITTKETVTVNKEIIGSIGGQIRWSPDETKLAMTCSIEQQPSSAVCLLDVQNGHIEVLLNEKNTDKFCSSNWIQFLDWSKDGTKIAYECFIIPEKGQKQDFKIYSYDLAAKSITLILDGISQDLIWQLHSASISPNNNALLINGAGQKPIQQIFLLDMPSGVLQQITTASDYHSTALVWRDNQTFYAHTQLDQSPYDEANFIMNTDSEKVSTLIIEGFITK
jgi:Tol biopolymer transport system component